MLYLKEFVPVRDAECPLPPGHGYFVVKTAPPLPFSAKTVCISESLKEKLPPTFLPTEIPKV